MDAIQLSIDWPPFPSCLLKSLIPVTRFASALSCCSLSCSESWLKALRPLCGNTDSRAAVASRTILISVGDPAWLFSKTYDTIFRYKPSYDPSVFDLAPTISFNSPEQASKRLIFSLLRKSSNLAYIYVEQQNACRNKPGSKWFPCMDHP